MRTMKEKDLSSPIEKDGFEDELTKALDGMGTWRNRLIMPELKDKGMEPPDVKEMDFEVIRDSMNKALKSEEPTNCVLSNVYLGICDWQQA